MNAFEWVNAATIADALALLGPRSTIKAGGVDLMDLLKERLVSPQRLVNLRTVPGLDRVNDTRDGLRMGPLVTLAAIAAHAGVQRRYRALADAAGHAATPQIRNMATAGGNLLQRPRCWYFRQEAFPCKKKGGARCFAQDGENQYHAIFGNGTCAAVHPSALAVALVALRAKVELTSVTGTREVDVEAFFTRPEAGVERENDLRAGEILTEIRIPPPAVGATSAYTKQGEKESFDWPLVEVAVAIERNGAACTRASVVLGAVAHTPHRARTAEAALIGKTIDDASARAAAKAATEGATPLGENAYKVQLVEAIVRRTILAAAKGTP